MAEIELHKAENHTRSVGFSRRLREIALLAIILPGTGAAAMEQEYMIEISKSDRELMVKKGDQIITKFRIAYGKGGNGGKRRQGDNKTPVGIYRVMNFKADSKFHYFMQIDYPNLTDAWYGYQEKIINEYDFRQIAAAYKSRQAPPQYTPLGGYIGIHGLGEVSQEKLKIHNEINWTEGCIALRNHEISELRNYVTIGTRIIIRE